MDPDPDPGGPKSYRSDGSGSATLLATVSYKLPGENSRVQVVLLQMPEVVTVDDNDEDKLDFEADEPEN
jgi:hypothetical protein